MFRYKSLSLDRSVALQFLAGFSSSDDTERVLIEIIADPHLDGSKPFANITSFSFSLSNMDPSNSLMQ